MTDRQRRREYKKFCKLLYKKKQPTLEFWEVILLATSTIALILLLFFGG